MCGGGGYRDGKASTPPSSVTSTTKTQYESMETKRRKFRRVIYFGKLPTLAHIISYILSPYLRPVFVLDVTSRVGIIH